MRVKLCEFDVVLLHAKKNKNQMSEIPEFNQEVANGRPRNTILYSVCKAEQSGEPVRILHML